MEEPFRDVPAGTRLIETMLWTPDAGVALAGRHRDRLCLSARALGFPFSPKGFNAELNAVNAHDPQRLRLTLARDGALEMTQAPVPAPPVRPWRVAIAKDRLTADDPWLRVKSTRRALYDQARAALPEGVDEMLFLNDRGQLCEGTICNLLVERDGIWLTPPLTSGLLPGVMRAELLARGSARVAALTEEDLRQAPRIALCNALRGVIPAEMV